MSMQKNYTQSDTPKIVIQKEKVPAILADDATPILAGDLNAAGHGISNVKNIETETINGIDLLKALIDLRHELQKWASERISTNKHKHALQDLPELSNYIEVCIEQILLTKNLPKHDHSHALKEISGDLPLSRLEKGQEIAAFIQKKFAEKEHSHPEYEQISSPNKGGTGKDFSEGEGFLFFKNGNATLAYPPTPEIGKEDLEALEEKLSFALLKGIGSIPSPKKEDPEICMELRFTQSILVPRKCNGLKLVEVCCKTPEGEVSPLFDMLKNGEKINMNAEMKTDDVLTLTPSQHCLVRLTFR